MRLNHFGKFLIFGQKAYAGVDGIRTRQLSNGQNRPLVQIGVLGRRWTDANSLVRKARVHGISIGS